MTDYNTQRILQRTEQTLIKYKEIQSVFPVLTIDELLALPDQGENWLIDRIVLSQGITIVSGLPNHFKSLFTQFIVKAVASGTPFLGKFQTQQGKVLVIDREIPKMRLKRRWSAIGNLENYPIHFYDYSAHFKLDNHDCMEKLTRFVKEHEIALLVIDTFNRSHSGKDLSSPSDVAKVFEPLKALLEFTSIVIVHHSNKSGYTKENPSPEELLGSIDFLAETDLLFTLRKKNKNTIAIHNLKARDSELIDPFELSFTVSPNGTLDLIYEGDLKVEETPVQKREREILELLERGKRKKEEIIAHMKNFGEKEGTIDNTLTLLKKRGKIDSELQGKEAYYFLLETYRDSEEERFPPLSSIGVGKQGNVEENTDLSIQNVSYIENDNEDRLSELGIDPNKTSDQLTDGELLKIFPGAKIEEAQNLGSKEKA